MVELFLVTKGKIEDTKYSRKDEEGKKKPEKLFPSPAVTLPFTVNGVLMSGERKTKRMRNLNPVTMVTCEDARGE